MFILKSGAQPAQTATVVMSTISSLHSHHEEDAVLTKQLFALFDRSAGGSSLVV